MGNKCWSFDNHTSFSGLYLSDEENCTYTYITKLALLLFPPYSEKPVAAIRLMVIILLIDDFMSVLITNSSLLSVLT